MNYPIYFDSKKSSHLFELNDRFDFLKDLYIKNKLPNVLMLSGQKGLGKSTLINHLLFYIFDKNNYDVKNYNFDNKSSFYNQFLSNIFSNIIYLSGSDFKNIKIEDIRNLKSKILKTTILNKPRFIIFDDVELFNHNSLNALLKIIEEPNEKLFFILIHNNSKILSTLKSRCLSFKLFLSNKESLNITKKLIDGNIEDKINLDLINYYFTPGNILRLIEFFDKTDFELKNLKLKELLKLIIKEKIYKKNDNLKFIIYELIEFYLISKFILIKNNYYYYFINQIDNIKKFNLDEESLFIEFKQRLLNE